MAKFGMTYIGEPLRTYRVELPKKESPLPLPQEQPLPVSEPVPAAPEREKVPV